MRRPERGARGDAHRLGGMHASKGSTSVPIGDTALDYARVGYAVLALRRNAKTPATRNGLRDATTDDDRITQWLATGCNVGLLPPAEVLVIDADTPDEVMRLESEHPELATAPRCDTPSGGAHIYTRLPEDAAPPRATCRVDGRALDIRGMGRAYLVAPPSVIDGRAYRWARPLVSPAELPETPAELLAMLCPPRPARTIPPRHVATPPRGEVTDRERRYALAALQREHDNLAATPEGARNGTLNRAAYNLGQLVGGGALERHEAEDALRAAAATCGLPAAETERTIASGLAGGMRSPRGVPSRGPTATGKRPMSYRARVRARMRGWGRGA